MSGMGGKLPLGTAIYDHCSRGYSPAMSRYEAIDPILSDWAVQNRVRWYSEYQDTEVRTFYLNPDQKDRIQVSVDAPLKERTVVRIGQLQRGLSRLSRMRDFPTTILDLSSTLDRALQAAKEWLSEGEQQA